MYAETPIGIRSLIIALALTCGACSDPQSVPRSVTPSVVWIEVDTLRADALGCYGNVSRGENGALPSPAIDGLAREGVLFEYAYSAAPWTVPSLVTQLTGEWPWVHGALRLLQPLDTRLPNLVERFRGAGWRTAAVMTNFVVQDRLGFDRGFDVWDQSPSAAGHQGSTALQAAERLLEITDELLQRPGDGLFLLLFLFEPHYRYEEHVGARFGPGYSDAEPYLGELTGAEELTELRARRSELTAADIAFLRGRYRGEVAHVDRAIGSFLDGLRERGMLDRSLIVFTSDHGEELMERGWIGHTRSLHDELVRVPLILRLPHDLGEARAGLRIEAPVSQIDLGATLLDLMGIDADLGSGLSFAATVLAGDKPPRRYLFLHTDFDPPLRSRENLKKRALQWGVVDAWQGEKWIVDRHPDHRIDGKPATAWFDLLADPGELRNLAEGTSPPARFFQLPELDPANEIEGGQW